MKHPVVLFLPVPSFTNGPALYERHVLCGNDARSYKNAHSSRKEEWALVAYAGVLLGTIQLCGRYFQAERRGVRSESQGAIGRTAS